MAYKFNPFTGQLDDAITLTGSGSVAAAQDGTEALPGISFANDLNTGIYRPGADQVAISTNGEGRLFVNSSGNLTLGQPLSALQSGGTGLTVYGASASEIKFLNSTTGAAVTDGTALVATGNDFTINNRETGAVVIGTSNTERLHITSTGELKHIGGGSEGDPAVYFAGSAPAKSLYVEATTGHVGLGTSSPGTLLHARITSSAEWTSSENLSGSTNIQNAILNLTNSSDAITGTESTLLFNAGSSGGAQHSITCKRTSATVGDLIFRTRSGGGATSSELMRLTGSGRLGVGTTEPGNRLTVIDRDTPIALKIGENNNATTEAGLEIQARNTANTSGYSLQIAVDADEAAATIDFNGSERARINSSGYLLVGAIISPTASVSGVQISNPITQACKFSAGSVTSSVNQIAFINGNGTVGTIATNASATAYNTSSDYRLKENVTSVTDGITRLQQLKPSRFNFIADPTKTVDGFLAHEVQTVVPEAITGEKDAVDADGNPEYQGIDQSKLVPLLTAALQEAVAKIESLEARLTAAGI